jgi:acetyl-CoA synthetase
MSAPSQTPVSPERLAELLDVKTFPSPADFAAKAKVTDPGIYEQAAADAPAWWAGQARQRLHWQTPFQAVLDDSAISPTAASSATSAR